MNNFDFFEDEASFKKEKQKARVLRNSQWWKRKRSSGICYYCNNKFVPKELTMDHVIPISRGGKTEKSNVAPCCKECNTKKMQLLPIEWEEYMSSLSKNKNSDKQ
ncbi:MAG: HNH endonuclease [Desulfobacterales bacterium]|nr:HNH endonuclease [Desulfobacterales bacterium]